MRALLVSTGTTGNMLPFVGFGTALRVRGHDVTLFGSSDFAEIARQEGFAFVDLSPPESQREALDSEANPSRRRGFLRALNKSALRLMERVYRLVAECYVPGETVVAAQGWLFGARLAQEKLGAPLATICLQPLMLGSVHDAAGLPRWAPRWVPRLVRRLVHRSVDRALAPALDDFRAGLGLPPVSRPVMTWWQSPQLTIGFFPAWYSAPQPDWPAHTVLGGFPFYTPKDALDSHRELDEFLASGEPPLVFSQASLVKDAQDYFAASVAVAQNLGRRALLLTPHRRQVPPRLPSDIRHFDFAPLSRLLPRAAAIVHHGGIGTIGLSLAAGTPQLTVPRLLDQFDNSRRLLRLGVSANLRASAYRPAKVARVLRDLLDSPKVAERCRHYANLCREEKPFEEACRALEQLHEVSRG